MRGYAALVFGVLLLGLGMALPPQAGATYNVYVGYADTFGHPNTAPLPTPWSGGSNVTEFQGGFTVSPQSWDAGAIRIDNTGGSSLAFGSIAVYAAGNLEFTWTPFSLAAGKTAILTQTSSWNFDISNINSALGNPVDLIVVPDGGSTPANFYDTAMVFDSEGIGLTEGHDWVPATPEPSSLMLLSSGVLGFVGLGATRIRRKKGGKTEF